MTKTDVEHRSRPDGRRRQNTRERILAASLDLFLERGFDGTSISDIERAVGLAAGTGSFYRHFRSKDDVFVAAVQRSSTASTTPLSGSGATSTCGSPPSRSSIPSCA